MRGQPFRSFALIASLAAITAGCGQETGTFVKLLFSGTVSKDQPIASIAVDLQLVDPNLGTRASSTSFPMSNARPNLPTTGVLQIGSGHGTLYVAATALAADGSVLGTGTGSGTVVRDKTVEVPVLFSGFVGADAGADGPDTDTRPPAVDAGLDSATDGATDRPFDVDVSPDLSTLDDGPGRDKPLPGDAPADAGETADVALDLPGGGGGSGGTTTGGAGGAGTGGVGGTGGTGTGGTSASYLLVANPSSVDFGVVLPGNISPPQGIEIVNRGNAATPPLTLTIADPKTFPITKDTCSNVALAPGQICNVAFSFSPGASGAVRTDGAVAPAGGLGAKFQLSGTGAGGPATLSLSPAAPALGVVDVNTSVSVSFTLTNGGDTEAGTITIQVPGAPVFQLTANGCALPLGPRSQCAFTVSFAPNAFGPASTTISARSSLGLSATATMSGTGRDYVPLSIAFTGTGKGTVTGGPGSCASSAPCNFSVPRTDPAAIPKFELTAVADTLSTFGGWSGACSGNSATCSVLMDQPRAVTAAFNASMVPISLTVLGVAGGGGTLTSEDGTVTCSSICPNLSHAATTSFTLNAKPSPGSAFVGWTSGPCRGTKPTCTFPLTDAVSITATFASQPLYMFVTSSTVVPGRLGGIEGADQECQRLAEKAGLPGVYLAWLSTTGVDARERVGEGGWVRTDGRPFARSLKTLADPAVPGYPTVYYPPRLDEMGNDFGNLSLLVATGGNTDGTSVGTQCGDYKDLAGDLYVGDASSGSHAWSYSKIVPGGCGSPFHLYCFRSDVGLEIAPPPQDGRRIFISSKPYVMTSTGTSNPTVFCQKEADAAGLPDATSFVAFVATGSTPAIKLLKTEGPPWKRLDEVVVAGQVSDFTGGKLLAPVNVGPSGMTYLPNRVWTGGTDPSAPGTATCNDWKSGMTGQSALVGDSRTTAVPPWFSLGDTGLVPCNDTNTHLMCIQP
jgi:hypothetical protein